MNPIPPNPPPFTYQDHEWFDVPLDQPLLSPRIKEIQDQEVEVQEEIETDRQGICRRDTV